jgi:hypothetical protein
LLEAWSPSIEFMDRVKPLAKGALKLANVSEKGPFSQRLFRGLALGTTAPPSVFGIGDNAMVATILIQAAEHWEIRNKP